MACAPIGIITMGVALLVKPEADRKDTILDERNANWAIPLFVNS